MLKSVLLFVISCFFCVPTFASSSVAEDSLAIFSEKQGSPKLYKFKQNLEQIQKSGQALETQILMEDFESKNEENQINDLDLVLEASDKIKSSNGKIEILGIDVFFDNNNVVHLQYPIFDSKDHKLSIFKGPVKPAKYVMKIEVILGIVSDKELYVSPAGQWKIEKSFDLVLSNKDKKVKKSIKLVLVENNFDLLEGEVKSEQEIKNKSVSQPNGYDNSFNSKISLQKIKEETFSFEKALNLPLAKSNAFYLNNLLADAKEAYFAAQYDYAIVLASSGKHISEGYNTNLLRDFLLVEYDSQLLLKRYQENIALCEQAHLLGFLKLDSKWQQSCVNIVGYYSQNTLSKEEIFTKISSMINNGESNPILLTTMISSLALYDNGFNSEATALLGKALDNVQALDKSWLSRAKFIHAIMSLQQKFSTKYLFVLEELAADNTDLGTQGLAKLALARSLRGQGRLEDAARLYKNVLDFISNKAIDLKKALKANSLESNASLINFDLAGFFSSEEIQMEYANFVCLLQKQAECVQAYSSLSENALLHFAGQVLLKFDNFKVVGKNIIGKLLSVSEFDAEYIREVVAKFPKMSADDLWKHASVFSTYAYIYGIKNEVSENLLEIYSAFLHQKQNALKLSSQLSDFSSGNITQTGKDNKNFLIISRLSELQNSVFEAALALDLTSFSKWDLADASIKSASDHRSFLRENLLEIIKGNKVNIKGNDSGFTNSVDINNLYKNFARRQKMSEDLLNNLYDLHKRSDIGAKGEQKLNNFDEMQAFDALIMVNKHVNTLFLSVKGAYDAKVKKRHDDLVMFNKQFAKNNIAVSAYLDELDLELRSNFVKDAYALADQVAKVQARIKLVSQELLVDDLKKLRNSNVILKKSIAERQKWIKSLEQAALWR